MPHGEQLTTTSVAGLALIAGAVPACAILVPNSSLPILAALGAVLVVAAIPLLGRWSVLLLLPLLAIIPGAGWVGVGLGCLSAATLLFFLSRPKMVSDPEQVRLIRAELRDAEHERTLLHRHIQRYPALMEACLELSSSRELNQFAEVLCERTQELLPGITHVRVYLGSAEKQICFASADEKGAPCHVDAGPDQYYVATESRQLIRRDGRAVRLLTPLRGDRRQQDDSESLRGVLDVRLENQDVGDRLALELLNALGRIGGLGLGAVDLVNQARLLALHDDLTGLFGQHEFLRRLEEQAALSKRSHSELGVIMCDMDHLKRFNDTYGHLAGDVALRQVSAILQRELPEDAIICRYGGEEFAAIIPGLPLANIKQLATAVRKAISQQAVMVDNKEIHVTASLGVALWKSDETPRAALIRADGACYAAKAAGRNRVEVAT